MYARYRTRSRFYKRPEKVLKAYNVSPNLLRRPKVANGLLSGLYTDETVDLRDRERLAMLEAIRHPRERDFYQDHTYHNQWITRDLETHQRRSLAARYRFFAPDYALKPWLWYPGDVVEVVSGEAAGQRGVILAVVAYKNEIIVQDVNVRDVVIPAAEGRPEQRLQREHPIRVTRVRHVDPSTQALCHLEKVQVRDRKTGAQVESRMALESGVLLPIPPREGDRGLAVGDPLRETAMFDVEEPTYDPARERPPMLERRLRAMEDHFVRALRAAHDFHQPLRRRNGEAMRDFQRGVVARAAERLAARCGAPPEAKTKDPGENIAAENPAARCEAPSEAKTKDPGEHIAARPAWWRAMLAPYVEVLEEEAAERERAHAAEADQQRRESEAAMAAPGGRPDHNDDDDEDFQDDEEEDEEEDDDEKSKVGGDGDGDNDNHGDVEGS
ncbi:unnamed protein product [Phytomonas sp. Hart1]|nr:unnamed protein product [Phytomonas sp. Hart1]|eukprot:CCW70964.1 unnamed protein product [Phytomonas sp. isolate Hart1]